VFFLLLSHSPSYGAEITGPEVSVKENEIHVTTSLSLEEKYLKELRNGIAKELRFYVDLFKVWKILPDEFVLRKYFIRTLKCDPVKNEFVATSYDGTTLIEKRFKSFESMIKWTLSINELRLTNIRELEPGMHFVRVAVESKIRKLPPLIGYLLIFLPENEFKITKDSPFFAIGAVK
jgi:hypothetical protein